MIKGLLLFNLFLFSFSMIYSNDVTAKTMAQCKKDYKKCKKRNPFNKKRCKKKRKKCDATAQALLKAKTATPATSVVPTPPPPKTTPQNTKQTQNTSKAPAGPLPKVAADVVLTEMADIFKKYVASRSIADRDKFATYLSTKGKSRLERGCREFKDMSQTDKEARAKKWKIPVADINNCNVNTMVAYLAASWDTYFYPLTYKGAKKSIDTKGSEQSEVTFVVVDEKKKERLIYQFHNEQGHWKFTKLSLRDP